MVFKVMIFMVLLLVAAWMFGLMVQKKRRR
ncbi:hypothetical protein STSO111631_05895 [Stackebrandtia soli]